MSFQYFASLLFQHVHIFHSLSFMQDIRRKGQENRYQKNKNFIKSSAFKKKHYSIFFALVLLLFFHSLTISNSLTC